MAGSIGRINAALATVYNENSAALVTLNFDFALQKVEAPAEYYPLGRTISRKRKREAEEGTLHKTARRLGALFQELLPPTEALFRVYGTRVSEIASIAAINPRQDKNSEGIFANHIGADTTSIWAAVTSGSASIAAHLLGCMLARIFTGPEATSAWVELVQKQKERIQGRQGDTLYSHEHEKALSAAKQDITRHELANWDASARAWLQSADQAKAFHHKQTMLIFNNIGVPVNNEGDTYTSVVKAWVTALEAMNSLVKGMPQRVQDGAALIALSSWHLYPDMIVYGRDCVQVKQKDPLFDQAALLTLGLHNARDETKSVYWSLPLAHLQYYGHPVQASRSVCQENSRVTSREFAYVVLGCLFEHWRGFLATNDEGLQWLERLGNTLELSFESQFDHAHKPTWLIYLLVAARGLADCDESEKRTAHQLMSLGRRRRSFMSVPNGDPLPLFGLSDLAVLLSVFRSDQQHVECLRGLCSHLKLDRSTSLIRYVASTYSWPEYASVAPVGRSSIKRTIENKLKSQYPEKLVRWIVLSSHQLRLCNERIEDLLNPAQAAKKIRDLQRLASLETQESLVQDTNNTTDDPAIELMAKRLNDIKELKEILNIGQRRSEIESQGELCLPLIEDIKDYRVGPYPGKRRNFVPHLFFSSHLEFVNALRELLQIAKRLNNPLTMRNAIPLLFFGGDEELAAIFSIDRVRTSPPSALRLWEQPFSDEEQDVAIPRQILTSKNMEEVFTKSNIDKERLLHYFHNSDYAVHSQIACLQACAIMAEIYHLLPGATISTLVVKQSLYRAKWIMRKEPMEMGHGHHRSQDMPPLTLSRAFACVAMFESGTSNVDPDSLSEVFAMSSGNSLYVAGSLLCDPHEQPKSTEIRRVVGNIGRAGITFLIPPPEVKVKDADPEMWMAINHNDFDGTLENYFKQTSIHLSFTAYEIPLITEDFPRHMIDRDVVLVEALISVYDGCTWIAEVDIIKALASPVPRACAHHFNHFQHKHLSNHQSADGIPRTYQEARLEYPQLTATSIENWDELIEAPLTGVIAVRAHKNWLARLAATAICVKNGMMPIIVPEEPCWTCCAELIPRLNNKTAALIC